MIVYENRASTILYNLMTTCKLPGPVLLPANVCPIVPITLQKAKRSFEFLDISLPTLSMDHKKVIERCLADGDKPSAVVYVRPFGAVFDASGFFREIKRLVPETRIIDDRCLCTPSFDAANLLDDVDAVLYSTGHAKHVDMGFGGYAILKDDICYRRAWLKYHTNDLEAVTIQYKDSLFKKKRFFYTYDDWLDSSSPGMEWDVYRERVQKRIIQETEVKRKLNCIYSAGLLPSIQFPSAFQSWRFNIHVENKEATLNAIRGAGLFASGHYDALDGLFGDGSGITARMLHRHTINLFNDRYFDAEKAERLVDVVVNLPNLAPSPVII